MHAHLVQLDIQWEDRSANFERVRNLLSQTPINPGDLIALPELFDAGFTLNTEKTIDHEDETLAFLQSLANETGCIVHGSRSIPSNDTQDQRAFNCATIVVPNNDDSPECEYRKIHPFSVGKELESYQPGADLYTYHWPNAVHSLRVLPAICYDLRFPELFRTACVHGAEMIVLGANWPEPRQHHWRSLCIARAIENQSFMLGINRTGSDPHLNYIGGTIAIDPKGTIIGELSDEEAVLSVEIDPTLPQSWRSDFPVFNDITIRSI